MVHRGGLIFTSCKLKIVWINFNYCNIISLEISLRTFRRAFPGGSVVKNPPASAGDTGLIPGPGRFYKPWSNKARKPQLLKPVCLEFVLHNNRNHHNEKPVHRNEI